MENAERLDLEAEPRRVRWAFPWKRKPSRRTVVIALATVAVAAGLFFGWGWVAAAGLSSIVLGVLPCVAMCAAGLCMNRFGQKNACAGSGQTPVNKHSGLEEPRLAEEIKVHAVPAENAASLLSEPGGVPASENMDRT